MYHEKITTRSRNRENWATAGDDEREGLAGSRFLRIGQKLAGFLQLDRHWSDTGRTGTCADEHNRGVVLRVVSFRMALVPSPIAKNALVNEGEGLGFVCHISFDAQLREMPTLRKYNDLSRGDSCQMGNSILSQLFGTVSSHWRRGVLGRFLRCGESRRPHP